MAIRARLGPYLTTLPMCRRSSAAPLGRIDYNVGILSPSPSYERLAMASQPCLLTPAQAALAPFSFYYTDPMSWALPSLD